MARSPRRHRSRSRQRETPRSRRNSGAGHGGGRERPESSPRHAERSGRTPETPKQKSEGEASGRQKARDAMEKEREKARLKKLEKDKAQKEKEENRQKALARKREDAERAVEETVSESAALALVSKPVAQAKIKPQTEEEQRAEAKKAAAVAAAAEIAMGLPKPVVSPSSTTAAAEIDETSLGKLFELLDRNNKGQVSQRDVLVALRKHPPVRRLFGLPVTNVEEGGDRLEARLLAIQDAFEAGSGLGEAKATFEELKAGAAGDSCPRDSFFSSCKAGETLRARAAAAAAILPREHSTGAAFVATREWRVVPQDAACPGGLEYKMDMETGRTMARLPPSAKGS